MSENRAGVAIITRTKNRTLMLERAISSVLSQTFSDWHHVVVNDGGDADNVNDVFDRYRDRYQNRLTVIHNSESQGMEAASNIGITNSDSTYVVIHDDDDTWECTFLERCIDTLKQSAIPSVKGVVSQITQIFERIDGNEIIEERRLDFNPGLSGISLPQIAEINRFLPISFLFERSVIDEIGLYDESLPVVGDWEFNIRFFSRFDVVVIREKLANYHIRTDSERSYENSVTAGKSDHLFYRSLIVNKHIRKDMQSGKFSIGMLLAQGDFFHRTSGNLVRIGTLLDKMKELPVIKQLRKLLKK